MANLAIKGHPTRGGEVIQLLEMLGGVNVFNLDGAMDNYYYYIDENSNKICHCLSINFEYGIVYTLEEFEEKFPYKEDDVVVNHKYGKGLIIRMLWIDNEIVYEIEFEDYMAYCKANELCKYDAFKGLLLQELTEYLSHATREELDKTMEEIEIELAPFKVGDKVIVKGYEEMGEDEIIYVFKTYDGDIKYKTKNHLETHYFMEDRLTKVEKSYKKETMEEKDEKTVNHIFDTEVISFDIAQKDKYEFDLQGKFEVILREGKYYVERIKPQYPKTYKECCKILNIPFNGNIVYAGHWVYGGEYLEKHLDVLRKFQQLLICRDAYWKIAGEQMGLGKPWKPEWESETEQKYTIITDANEICNGLTIQCNAILAFPTEEMRNAFYENFEDLINDCKELL